MNKELMNTLVAQCPPQGYQSWMIDLDKYTELVVIECSRVAKLESKSNKVCDAIESHFGIVK